MPATLDDFLNTPEAKHIQYFDWAVANAIVHDEDGTLNYAFGEGFKTLANLQGDVSAFGIQDIWFGRYFKRNALLPTLHLGESRAIELSQLGIAYRTKSGDPITDEQTVALKEHVFHHLPITEDDVDILKFQHDKDCCHSPCFGCTCFDVHTAISKQGRTPWLAILEAAKA